MFMGVHSHYNVRQVNSYADAQAVLAKFSRTPTGKARREKPYGFHLSMNRNHSVTWVRETADQSIAFRLYETDVVTWHPDNSFTLVSWPSVTTRDFASGFTPDGVSLSSNETVTYRPPVRDGDWRASWDAARICRGDATFRQTDAGWAPDEAELEPIRFLELDQKKARALSREYRLKDFSNYLAMAPLHMNLMYEGEDCPKAVEALKERDFRRAAVHLPLIASSRAFGNEPVYLRIAAGSGCGITMSSVDRLRDWIYDRWGAFSDVSAKTWPLREFENRMKRLKALEKADVRTYGYGI